ncbi:hypothetical protein PGT21_011967 [Puccinia graminis f. sp. tritici]|uniref:Uncharacterized protein n=1 Tax=Puccinia graminis f. sp. tritici TaxID=56615 RepID=A0A5B0MNK6_PUCGR|nr:hypothetical protein PGT21_011967 [Puccinia graminis f. sp. tritici]
MKKRSIFSVPSPYQARPAEPSTQSLHLPSEAQDPDTQVEEVVDTLSSQLGFEDSPEDVEEVGVSTIHVRLDCSKAGRMLIPVAFSSPTKGSVIVSVLIDTGFMANFISNKFVQDNGLPTHA